MPASGANRPRITADLQDQQIPRLPRIPAGQVGDPVQPVADGVGVHEQVPRGRLQRAAGGQVGLDGGQQRATARRPAARYTAARSRAAARWSPPSTRSASRSSASMVAGRTGQAAATSSPASASAAETTASRRPAPGRPRTTGPSPNKASISGPGGSLPASTSTSRSPCTPDIAARPTAIGPVGDRGDRVGPVTGRRRPGDDQGVGGGVPVQRGGPGGQRPEVLAADDAVDDRGLDPGIPGAAGLGGGGVDRGGGEGHLPAVPQQRIAQRDRSPARRRPARADPPRRR